MTEAEILLLWVYAHEKWPNYPLPQPGSEADLTRRQAWLADLGDLPAEAVRLAMSDPVLAGREWFPPLGAVRQAALDLLSPADRPPDADQAWAEAQRAARAVGLYGEPAWTHPAVGDAVASIGWREMCAAENLEATRAHFLRFYELAAARASRSRLAPPSVAALAAGERRAALDAPRHELEAGDG